MSYRLRLIIHTLLLMALFSGTLAYIYTYTRHTILDEAQNGAVVTARLLSGTIELEESRLLHYAEIVRDDPRIKSFLATERTTNHLGETLATAYQRNFGWLPVDRYTIMTTDGDALPDTGADDLVSALSRQINIREQRVFYFQGRYGLEVAAWAPVVHEGQTLGYVALTTLIDQAWLERHRQNSGGELVIEQNGIVTLASLALPADTAFIMSNNRATLDNKTYRVRPIVLPTATASSPRLWHGISEDELLSALNRHTELVVLFALVACLGILSVSTFLIRNFYRPLAELTQITEAVTAGDLPLMEKTTAHNEIGVLANRFSEMLQALREKQHEIETVHRQLAESAIRDSLTNLYNRRYLKDAFPKIAAQAKREGATLSGLLLDLDHFKVMNDQYGHLAGDQCLIHLSAILQENSRANDYLFRLGGEEFLVLSLGENTEGAVLLAEKLRAAVAWQPATYEGTTMRLSTSIGVAYADTTLPADEALRQLLSQADAALYQAKDSGRNQVRVHQVTVSALVRPKTSAG